MSTRRQKNFIFCSGVVFLIWGLSLFLIINGTIQLSLCSHLDCNLLCNTTSNVTSNMADNMTFINENFSSVSLLCDNYCVLSCKYKLNEKSFCVWINPCRTAPNGSIAVGSILLFVSSLILCFLYCKKEQIFH